MPFCCARLDWRMGRDWTAWRDCPQIVWSRQARPVLHLGHHPGIPKELGARRAMAAHHSSTKAARGFLNFQIVLHLEAHLERAGHQLPPDLKIKLHQTPDQQPTVSGHKTNKAPHQKTLTSTKPADPKTNCTKKRKWQQPEKAPPRFGWTRLWS